MTQAKRPTNKHVEKHAPAPVVVSPGPVPAPPEAAMLPPKPDGSPDLETTGALSGDEKKIVEGGKEVKVTPIHVKAIAKGFYGNYRLNPGEKFFIAKAEDFSSQWMELVNKKDQSAVDKAAKERTALYKKRAEEAAE